MRKTYVCFGCKESFPAEKLIEYAGLMAKNTHKYCPKCYEEKISKEKFFEEICKIFGIKRPGAQIYTERKRLLDLGYTDKIIIDCLHYIYDIKKIPKKKPTLFFVTKENILEMTEYQRKEHKKNEKISLAPQQQIVTNVVKIKENTTKYSTSDYSLNPDDWLNID